MASKTHSNSHEGLKYFWQFFRFGGILPCGGYKPIYLLYTVLYNVNEAIILPATLIMYIVEKGLEGNLVPLSVTTDIVIIAMKHLTMLGSRKHLYNIRVILEDLDKGVTFEDEKRCMERAVKMCRVFIFGFHTLAFGSLTAFAFIGLYFKKDFVFSAWYPFDVTITKKFWMAYAHQLVSVYAMAISNIALDMYAPAYIYVLTTHIEILMLKIEKVGKNVETSVEENYKELVTLIRRHNTILNLFDEISILISRTLSLQFLVTAFVLCLATVYLLFSSTELVEIITIVSYLMGIVFEVLPACYFAGRLMEYHAKLTGAIFSCNWMDQDQRFCKILKIFMQRSQMELVIFAWNVVPVSLPTFLGIIKFSFSLFTLLSQLNK